MVHIRQITPSISLGLLDLRAFSEQRQLLAKREQERAGTKFLLAQLFGGTAPGLAYTEHNKPYLPGRAEHISISHSHDRLAIILNREKSTGIDIELIRDKVRAVKHKFLNAQEALFAGQDSAVLIAIWAAKEAMYKFHGTKGLDFKAHLSVEDFDGSVIFGKIETEDYHKRFHLIKEEVGEYMMVYILDEI